MLNKASVILSSIFLVFALMASSQAATKSNSETKEKGEFRGIKQTEYPDWFKDSFLDFKEDIADAAEHNKQVMIIFHQNGCPYCNVLIERNFSQKDIVDFTRKNFDVISLNMWGSREIVSIGGKAYSEKDFAAALKVQFTPTIIFFNEQGKVALRLNGYIPPKKFKLALEYVAGKHDGKISYREYIEKNMPAMTANGPLHTEDFFSNAPYDLSRKKGVPAKPIAVFFEQRDCPGCDALHSKVLIDKKVREVLQGFDVIQLDMWSTTTLITPQGQKTTAREWAKELDVQYAPTIVVFNEYGKEIIRSEAFFKTFHTYGILEYVLHNGYKKQPSFQRYLSHHAEELREQGIDVDIW